MTVEDMMMMVIILLYDAVGATLN